MQRSAVETICPDLPHLANVNDHRSRDGIGIEPGSSDAVLLARSVRRLQEDLKSTLSGVGVEQGVAAVVWWRRESQLWGSDFGDSQNGPLWAPQDTPGASAGKEG